MAQPKTSPTPREMEAGQMFTALIAAATGECKCYVCEMLRPLGQKVLTNMKEVGTNGRSKTGGKNRRKNHP